MYSIFVPAAGSGESQNKTTSGIVATCSRRVRVIADGTLDEMWHAAHVSEPIYASICLVDRKLLRRLVT